MKLRYFAWVRERVGRTEEDLAVPDGIVTVGELLDWLRARGPEYQAALYEPSAIRVALDHLHVRPDASLSGAREMALFPPMTGG